MDADARHLTACEETRDGGAPLEVGEDPAGEVVGGGRDGDGVVREIEPGRGARRRHGREARRYVRDRDGVEVHLPGLVPHECDGSRHDVARRELATRIEPRHEPLAPGVEEHCALAAKGLGEQPRGLSGDVQRGRMELDELEVGERGADVPSERHALPGCAVRSRAPSEDAGGAARRQDHPPGLELRAFEPHATDAAAIDQKRDGALRPPVDAPLLARGRDERAKDRPARRVAARMQDPSRAVPAFERRRAALVEHHAAAPELLDGERGLRREGVHGARIAEPCARGHRVFGVRRRRVAFGHRRGDPALRERGRAPRRRVWRHERHRTDGRRVQGRPEPGRAGTDDDRLHARGGCGQGTGIGAGPSAIIRSTAAAARTRISSGTVTSNTPSSSERRSFAGVIVFMY